MLCIIICLRSSFSLSSRHCSLPMDFRQRVNDRGLPSSEELDSVKVKSAPLTTISFNDSGRFFLLLLQCLDLLFGMCFFCFSGTSVLLSRDPNAVLRVTLNLAIFCLGGNRWEQFIIFVVVWASNLSFPTVFWFCYSSI